MALMDKLNMINSKTRDTLLPQVELYADQANRFVAAHAAHHDSRPTMSSLPLPTIKQLKDSHTRISELLLQQLLVLDGVSSHSEGVRGKRRESVKMHNAMLDRVDGLRDRVQTVIKDKGLL